MVTTDKDEDGRQMKTLEKMGNFLKMHAPSVTYVASLNAIMTKIKTTRLIA